MLIELFGRNFGSFRDEFRLSMLATDIDPGNERGVVEVPLEGEEKPLRLLRCAAIYGPNASGKTTVLRAASALGYLITASAGFESDRPLPPFEPFLLDTTTATHPVTLGVRAVIGHRVYEYVIEFTGRHVESESLVELGTDEERTLVKRHGGRVEGAWTSDPQIDLVTRSFRPNALLLSLADRLAPKLAGGIAAELRRLLQYHDFTWTLPPWHGAGSVAQRAYEDAEGFGRWMLGWLKDADVGILDYTAEELPPPPESMQDDESGGGRAGRPKQFALAFLHTGAQGPVRIRYLRESMGTRKLAAIAPFMHDLTSGGQACGYFIDEIAASLHPGLFLAFLRRFNCDTKPESVRGQLIFATHETIMLDGEAKDTVLRRDQVYLTEKDQTGVSRLYSVADFKERNNLNLRRRYLQGRYGAVPAVGRHGD